MRERPIIMSGESSRSIRAKLKTHTRRVIVPQPDHFHDFSDGMGWRPQIGEKEIRCPYGQVGDRLWVRETWAALWPDVDPVPLHECTIEYRADSPNALYPGDWPAEEAKGNDDAPKWRSPLFMPRWACRTVLEIVSINAERLHDITGRGVLAEGIDEGKSNPTMGIRWENMQRMAFQQHWDAINARRGHPWVDNPWVWDIGFKLVEQEQ